MLKSFLLVAAMVVGLGSVANAQERRGGLFVEPGITYEFGTTNTSTPVGDSGGTNRGFGLMGRLGFHVSDVVFLAADARYSKPHFKDGNIDADADAYQVGPVVGIQMPVAGLRVWGEYIAQAQLDPGATNNFDAKFKNGTGFSVGAGFHLLAVSLNLEYQKVDYKTTEFQAAGPFTNAGDSDRVRAKNEAYVVSVSFPLSI